jgi:Acetyltransferase (GNAT) domain
MQVATLAREIVQEQQAAEPLNIRVFRSTDDIKQLRSSWSAMQHHPNSDIDFYLMLNRARPETVPYVMVLYRGSCPKAMLVGRIEDNEIEVRLGYARLFAPKLRTLNIVYQGALGELDDETSQAFLQEIMRVLKRGEAQAAVFRFVRTDSPLYSAITRSAPTMQRDYCPAAQVHRSMSLPSVAQGIRSRFSAKTRKNHRWQANKLLQDNSGNVRVKCFQQESELEELFRDAEQIARKTYQRGLGVGFEDSPRMRDRLGFEMRRGGLRAYLLYVGDRPSAFWIGTVYKGTFFSSFMGYDPGLARYSPGTFLLLQVLEDFCAARQREVTSIDFGLGDAPYKQLLGDGEWQEASVHLFGSSPGSVALNLIRTPLLLLDKALRRILVRTNLLARVKHFWRQRVSRVGESSCT